MYQHRCRWTWFQLLDLCVLLWLLLLLLLLLSFPSFFLLDRTLPLPASALTETATSNSNSTSRIVAVSVPVPFSVSIALHGDGNGNGNGNGDDDSSDDDFLEFQPAVTDPRYLPSELDESNKQKVLRIVQMVLTIFFVISLLSSVGWCVFCQPTRGRKIQQQQQQLQQHGHGHGQEQDHGGETWIGRLVTSPSFRIIVCLLFFLALLLSIFLLSLNEWSVAKFYTPFVNIRYGAIGQYTTDSDNEMVVPNGLMLYGDTCDSEHMSCGFFLAAVYFTLAYALLTALLSLLAFLSAIANLYRMHVHSIFGRSTFWWMWSGQACMAGIAAMLTWLCGVHLMLDESIQQMNIDDYDPEANIRFGWSWLLLFPFIFIWLILLLCIKWSIEYQSDADEPIHDTQTDTNLDTDVDTEDNSADAHESV